ncbi:M1 family aminopeptidase [Maricaulis sp.]|uniref:ABC transporter permease/M1 family aminopeptidase n=1 Tax=Maricaulis sp. TaxID=1486257 RepID=UPI0026321A4D|nr:M1 family aminopeptidase [Maricaulis sp.]
MLSKIAGFEVRYQLFSPVFIAVFAIFFLLVFAGVTIDNVQVGGGGATNINSPNALTINIAIFSLIGGLIPAAFLSSGVIRDRSFKTEELFFSRPVKEFDFVLGRFIGGFVATALCFISVPLAFLLGSWMPWLDQELIGPTNLGWYLYLYASLGLVNMWVVGTVLFTVANFTRSQIFVWVAFLGLLVLYFVGSAIAGQEPELRDELALIDPFGFNTFAEVTRYWTAFEANSQVIPFEGLYMANRFIWIGVGLALLAINLATFRFRKGGSAGASKKSKAQTSTGPKSAISDLDLPRMTPVLNGASTRQQFFARLSFEVKGVVLNVAFWVILAFGLFNTVPGFFFANGLYGTDNYPVTRVMMDIIAGAYSIIPIIIVIYYAAELMWRERRFRFNEITDSTPTASWVFITSKFLAMMVVIVSLALVAVIAAAVSQLIMGYTVFEFDQYTIRAIMEIILPAALLAALAIFLQVLMNNRWLGMAAMLVFFVFSLVASQMGFDHNLYQYGSAPGAPYSDMNGYGHFLGISLWFSLYWSFWALLLMVLAYQLWSRGALTPITTRLRRLFVGFTPATASLALVALVGAGATGSWIFYNTNIRNEYISGPDQRALAAEYERTYWHLVDEPQPTVTDTAYEVDIYPDERRYTATGQYTVQNKTDVAIETVWISYGQGTDVLSHALSGATLASEDERFLLYSFELDQPLQPGESLVYDFSVENGNPGFRNSGNVTTTNYNGTFFNNFQSMPVMGINTNLRLTDRSQRRQQDLEPVERAFPLEDEHRHFENGISNADYVTFRSIVSTSSDQIAIAPGYLEREWEEGGRRYFEYVMDRPILNFYSWMSADYSVAEREVDGVNLQVFYHEPHHWNVERMLEASADSLAYFSENLSPYQYRQFRILEFPAYQSFAQAFPNTIPYSEGIGFIGDLRDPDDIDYVYYVTAHEAAHQWWAHQVMAANVQGGTMLIETFAQYSALMVMREEYGEDAMRRFLKYELDRYLGGRGSEAIEEQPLYRVENQQYIHYRKGSVIMYALQDYLGEETVNRAMRRLIDDRAFSSEPYATTLDFLNILREEAGPEWETMIHDFFERIVLFDLQVTEATASEREDGRWDVAIEVEARKFSADGEGQQTEEPIDYMIDIGVFNRDLEGAISGSDHVLYMDKHQVNETTMRFEFTVDEEPQYVGIDPYNKLVDRNSDDNLSRVTIQ